MKMRNSKDIAKNWLNEVSNDESWIDGSSVHVLRSLIELIDEIREEAIAYSEDQRGL